MTLLADVLGHTTAHGGDRGTADALPLRSLVQDTARAPDTSLLPLSPANHTRAGIGGFVSEARRSHQLGCHPFPALLDSEGSASVTSSADESLSFGVS